MAVIGQPRYRVLGLVVPLTAAVAASSLLGLLGQLSTPGRIDAAKEYLASGRTAADIDRLDDELGAGAGLGAVSTLAGIVTIVMTLLLLYRILANVRAMRGETTWHPLWAIFGWLLPPVLFVIPSLATQEAWKASSPDRSHNWRSSPGNWLVWVWFATYSVGAGFFGVATAVSTVRAIDLDNPNASFDRADQAQVLIDTAPAQYASAVLLAVAGALWIALVRQLSARHAAFTGERA